jgi:hypothetical protein
MSTHHHVPADDDPQSVIDLVDDAREVSGVLAPYVPGEIRLPSPRGVLPFEIDAAALVGADGWGDYGS